MSKPLKYRFREMIRKRYKTREEIGDQVRKWSERWGVSERQFHRICSYPIDSKHEAKPSQLRAFAAEYNCKVDDLLN